MFKKNAKDKPELQKEIDRLLVEMSKLDTNSEEYNTLTTRLTALYPLLATNNANKISKETFAMIGANLAGIAVILGHERFNVISTKALSFITKTLR